MELVKGMNFATGKDALYAVQDYALRHNKRVRVGSRGGKHRRVVCTSDACPFFVQLYQHHSKTDTSWYLSSMNVAHADHCTSTGKPTQRQLLQMDRFRDAVLTKPQTSAATLALQVENEQGNPLAVNLRTIYRAKEALRSSFVDKRSLAYRKIPSLLRVFASLNDGSYTDHAVSADGSFVRAFVACGVFSRSMEHHQQILGFECVETTEDSHGVRDRGVHMYLFGKDGNMKTLLLAAAVCPELSREHLHWFFKCVEASGVNFRQCPIICAMDPRLMAIIGVELGATIRFCTKYIIETELVQISGFGPNHHALVWDLQASETEEEYESRLKVIRTSCGNHVEQFLRLLPMERWVVAGNVDKIALYGCRTRNLTEPQRDSDGRTDLVERLRSKLPHDFLEAVMESWLKDAFERSDAYSKWIQNGLKITVGAQELYDDQCKNVSDYTVGRASPSIAFVSQADKPQSSRRRVDLSTNSCSCGFIHQHGIPCRHMIAVLLLCEQMDSIANRFATAYFVSSYGAAFNNKYVELPLNSNLRESDTCLPPRTRQRAQESRSPPPQDESPGAPESSSSPPRSSKRTHDDVDGATETQARPKTHRCRLCKGSGHNARSCGARPHVDAQTPSSSTSIDARVATAAINIMHPCF
ncbi:hypothetical protein Poli38472_008798 [Pythium oligandrum]|uniref:SWIM-type domain-containing protein n=1 Tax=Pythium oligandrum TaxID=41045 RepID=A0A8K1C4B0_PYTOL|nr:hypothetical protein Poli38472_008798 [Pythium oligandrum]|eukprot:TMW56150.1 hypothetical protein Poli38472_008798 [Pythium oligandrum]